MAADDEAERYRKAAELALRQLDWCEGQLRSMRKTRLAEQIAKNSGSIRRRLQAPVRDEAAGRDLHNRA